MPVVADGETVIKEVLSSGGATAVLSTQKTTAGTNRCVVLTLSGSIDWVNGSVSVDYGGSAMTSLQEQRTARSANPDDCYAGIWYLVNPPTAATTITITWGHESWAGVYVLAVVASYNTVNQTTPFRGSDKNTSYTITLASATGDIVIDAYGAMNEVNTNAPAGNQTAFGSNCSGGYVVAAAQYAAGAASLAFDWVETLLSHACHVIGSLQPVGGATGQFARPASDLAPGGLFRFDVTGHKFLG